MNTQAQHIAVAEALGYKPVHDGRQFHGPQWELHPGCPKSYAELPPMDLNTMHAALDTLTHEQLRAYGLELHTLLVCEMERSDKVFWVFHAPIQFMREAFLIVVGQWVTRNNL